MRGDKAAPRPYSVLHMSLEHEQATINPTCYCDESISTLLRHIVTFFKLARTFLGGHIAQLVSTLTVAMMTPS